MNQVEMEVDGVLYEANYSEYDGTVRVYGVGELASTQVAGSSARKTAEMLLLRLIKQGLIHPATV